jgi:hypothetical protein
MKWTLEKFKEYRKLKRMGMSSDDLKKHFGHIIWESGLHNKNSMVTPILNEIKINPEIVDWNYIKSPSLFFNGKSDYIISFYSDNVPYILSFLYYKILDLDTYNIVFSTRDQWNEWSYNIRNLIKGGELDGYKLKELSNNLEKETNLHKIFPLFKKLSGIILDFSKNLEYPLSIGDTDNPKKIKFYRNIISDSFENFEESEVIYMNNKYYIYRKI